MFKLKDGLNEADFVEAAKGVEPFVQKMSGFVRRQLLQGEDGQWIDIVHWNSLDEALQATEAVMQEPTYHTFIGMIDESTMTMHHLRQAYTLN